MPLVPRKEKSRIFLSYGVRDTPDVAAKLHRDLTKAGYRIWQDLDRIRKGWAWDQEVQDGLRNSDIVLALLSPQSVRRAGTPGNLTNTDSVCLDEIAYARGVCHIPILPVLVLPCEAPFLIYRLHQIDFRRWSESEAENHAGLAQIPVGVSPPMRGEP